MSSRRGSSRSATNPTTSSCAGRCSAGAPRRGPSCSRRSSSASPSRGPSPASTRAASTSPSPACAASAPSPSSSCAVDARTRAVYIGRKLNFKITRHEVDRRGVNLVLSRRALLEADAQVRAAETRGKIAVGSVVRGVVTAVKEFGAFVDLGGIEGMLPASELGLLARPATQRTCSAWASPCRCRSSRSRRPTIPSGPSASPSRSRRSSATPGRTRPPSSRPAPG